ncbi:hypothetical protein C1N62_22825 (plasmid) [Nissabacter sp. SGAir0207]|nr:hypothetical protein C1N62_22825 [Nissabacter sp. SGAir0207]
MAASLALTTSLDSATAIAQLEQAAAFGVPQGGRLSLDQRMQGVQQHRLGPDAKQPDTRGPQGAAAAMTALYNQHKGINS